VAALGEGADFLVGDPLLLLLLDCVEDDLTSLGD
jgi:hypothetical protein